MRSQPLFYGVFCMAALTAAAWTFGPAPGPNSPAPAFARVLLISIDTLRPDRLESYGYRKSASPAISRLAAGGVRFEQAVAQVPLTLPSHCSILTGTHPVFHGVRDQAGFALPDRPETLAEILKREGYRTGAFVSSFVLDSRFGLGRGFDVYDDDLGSGRPAPLERRGDVTLARATAWLDRQAGARTFLWLHLYDPHVPYAAPEPWRSRHASDPYDGEVAYTDFLIGTLTQFLQDKGWYEDSLIVLLSDHGEDLGDHGENTHGLFLYDSTIRIPLIIKAGAAWAGKSVSEPVQSVDVAPTILQLLGLRPPPAMQGRGLLSLISGRPGRPAPAVGESFYSYYHFGWSPLQFYRSAQYKFIDAPQPELYDLAADPAEKNNLYANRQSLAHSLRQELQQIRERFRPGGEAASPSGTQVDEGALDKLRSLGYIGLSSRRALEQDYRRLPDPKDKLAVYRRLQQAYLDEQNGRWPEAASALLEILGSEPALTDVQIRLGLIYKRLGRLPEARRYLQKAVDSDPGSPIAVYNLAHVLALAGQLEAAEAGFRKTLALDPGELRARVGLGLIRQLRGDLEQAIAIYKEVLQTAPGDAMALTNLGGAYLSKGLAGEARAVLERALQVDPANPEIHNSLGSALLLEGDPSAAARFEKAIQLRPDFAEAWANLGLARLSRNQTGPALEALQKAVALRPQPAFHQLLGQAYAAAGMEEKARLEFEKARRAGQRAPR